MIFCMSRDGYAMVSPQQVRHTDSAVLQEVRRERRTARAIFKATISAISKVSWDAALVGKPADFEKGSLKNFCILVVLVLYDENAYR